MLPILRVLPIGGVLLAILILILALTPPEGRVPAVRDTALEARGPLIDRNEHPEWRQFIMQAAFRRADAVIGLLNLPSRPTRLPEIVVPLPANPGITITPADTERTAAGKASSAAAPMQVASRPAATTDTQPETPPAPAAAADPQPTAPPAPAAAEPPAAATDTPAIAALAPAPAPDNAPVTTPAPLATPLPADVPLPVSAKVPLPRSAKHKRPVPLPPDTPDGLRQVAVLPGERSAAEPAPAESGSAEDVTGTIPVGIGEASSTEVMVVLPPERPPVMRKPLPPKAHVAPQPAAPPRDLLGELFGTAPQPQPPARRPAAAPAKKTAAPAKKKRSAPRAAAPKAAAPKAAAARAAAPKDPTIRDLAATPAYPQSGGDSTQR